MYWRHFAVWDNPNRDSVAFGDWLLALWRENDDSRDYHARNGRFPADDGAISGRIATKANENGGYIETTVRLRNAIELLQLFVPLMAFAYTTRFLSLYFDAAFRD
jgi:lysocardiolipin and lysophospholipid acyltransferase